VSASVGINPNPSTLAVDDNLVNGQRYTFVFDCTNWFSSPTTDIIFNDITAQAPDFLTQITVQTLGSNYYVVFTYEGDGSDVVNDIANSIIAAVAATSGDGFSFVSATQGAQVINTPLPSASGTGLSLANIFEPVTPSQQSAQSAQAQAQIQQVATNAAIANGPTSTSAQVAQTAATQQISQVSADQSSIATSANAGSIGSLFNSLSGLQNSTTLIIIGLVLVIVGYFVVSSGGIAGAKKRVGVA
jgi:hypothetical protein